MYYNLQFIVINLSLDRLTMQEEEEDESLNLMAQTQNIHVFVVCFDRTLLIQDFRIMSRFLLLRDD